MDNEPILTIKNLAVAFKSGGKKLPVVRNVSFQLEKGEILALVGESGCGKSVSCLALGSLLNPAQTEVSAKRADFCCKNGEIVDLLNLTGRKLRKIRGGEIAYIFQEPSAALNPVFRIGDQIAEVLSLHRRDVKDQKAEVIKLLTDVGIPAPETRMNAFPHELSGGMQQRVVIAMALAGNPSLLIADEPTTALDVTIQAQILDLLSRLQKQRNMSVLLVTHNLGIVSAMADKVAVMYAGDIVEYGPCRNLIKDPKHPYTKALLRAVPRLGGSEGKLETIPGAVPMPDKFPAGCRFSDRCQECVTPGKCQKEIPQGLEIDGRICACFNYSGDVQ